MSNTTPTPDPSPPDPLPDPSKPPPSASSSASTSASTDQPRNPSTSVSPLRCFTGALIAGGLASALYSLTVSIAQTFAHTPIPSGTYVATNIAIAVRTLVVGVSVLGTGVFGIAALGLTALGIQLVVQQLRQPST